MPNHIKTLKAKESSLLVGWLVGWLEFNVPFQHKYGYIRDENPACKNCSNIQPNLEQVSE